MKFIVNPNEPSKISSGTVAMISYQNPEFKDAINKVFNINGNEYINFVEFSNDGIKVTIERY